MYIATAKTMYGRRTNVLWDVKWDTDNINVKTIKKRGYIGKRLEGNGAAQTAKKDDTETAWPGVTGSGKTVAEMGELL